MTTGTDLEWPADLPCPQELPTQSAERRVLGDDAGLFESRVGQTDRKSFEDYVFPPYSPAQALRLDYFWTVTLNKGGKWFSATFPRPEGRVPTARKFVGSPNWEYIHTGKEEGGYWRVSGTFEVRGTGQLPVEPDPPSAWNPLDIISATALPPCLVLTEDNRLATRATTLNHFEAGVRGYLSRAGVVGQRWYFEIEIVSPGDPSHLGHMQVGMVDATATNILSRPPPSDTSEITNLDADGASYVLAYTRFDGAVGYRSDPSSSVLDPATFGTAPIAGDIYGFEWHVGTSVTVSRNGVEGIVIPFAFVGAMFPYYSAGTTLVNGPNTTGTGESARIRTGKRQFATPLRLGVYAWG